MSREEMEKTIKGWFEAEKSFTGVRELHRWLVDRVCDIYTETAEKIFDGELEPYGGG